MKNYILLIIFCCFFYHFSLTQLQFVKTVNVIPRSAYSENSNNVKLEKIKYNAGTYYMIRFHKFGSNSKHQHPEMVPYCDHPTAYKERYYFYIFDENQMESLKSNFESKTSFDLNFVVEGFFDKEYPIGETAGVFNWPNVKTKKSIVSSFENNTSSSVFSFDFDKMIKDFTPIHFEKFIGNTWLKNKKIKKFITLIEL